VLISAEVWSWLIDSLNEETGSFLIYSHESLFLRRKISRAKRAALRLFGDFRG